MTEPNAGQRRHFHLQRTGRPERYQSTASPTRDPVFPPRDKTRHGERLLGQLEHFRTRMAQAVQLQRSQGQDGGFGLQLEFVSEPGFELAFEGLARGQQRIELLNVRYDGATQTHFATVFVPDGKLSAFEGLVTQYMQVNTSKGVPRNTPLLNPILEIRTATFSALWTDSQDALPSNPDEPIWWEFWLPVRDNQAAVLQRFRTIARALEFQVSTDALTFPERTVVNVYGTQTAITASMALLNEVAEIRRAKETAEFFDALTPTEQREWADDLLGRTSGGDDNSVRICLIDTGVNHGHPLLANHIAMADLHTVDADWGVQDDVGHGTGLAGVALYGDLVDPLSAPGPVSISHRIESVKLLPSARGYQRETYGSLTMNAVARPEIIQPDKQRVFSMAITSLDDRDRGRPSAWSAAVDLLTSDALGGRTQPRLMIVSAGNADTEKYANYPFSNQTDGIHDPGQSWNAICVGAYTQKVTLDPVVAGESALATNGSLSPYSTTSCTWTRTPWPLKPDVVFEGGNLVQDAYGIFSHTSLSLLTTSHEPQRRLFTTTWATSAASALASRMAAQISSAYPELWPETVRALVVHSAEWTERMKAEFLAGDSKADYEALVRTCGFGVPDIGRALWSASNSLTLVVEDSLRPFTRQGSKPATARDMHLHLLPWPQQELLNLGNEDVEMRVTLSYFVEPNPGVAERGLKGRYRYESHGLRFEVSRSGEDATVFRQRINRRAREEDDDETPYLSSPSDTRWLIGTRGRHKGSLHSDIWRGPASDLAGLGMIGIYPAPGWWKTLVKQQRFNDEVRYSLVVSIKTQQTEVDLYNAVDVAITNAAAIVT